MSGRLIATIVALAAIVVLGALGGRVAAARGHDAFSAHYSGSSHGTAPCSPERSRCSSSGAA